MIHVFNRLELLVTYDQDHLNRARDVLSSAGIEYIYRTKDLTSPTFFGGGSRGHTGTFGINHSARVEYKIYVRSVDFQHAKTLLREEGI